MPAIGSWSPSKASSPCFPAARRAPGLCRRCAGPPLGLEMLRAAKPRLGGGGRRRRGINPAWERVEGVRGAVLAQRWALCFKSSSGGFMPLVSAVPGPCWGGGEGGVERGVSSSLKVLTN